MLGHNTFDFALSPNLKIFGAPPPKPKHRRRNFIDNLPASTTTSKIIFENPQDTTDGTLNKWLIPTIVGSLLVVGIVGGFVLGRN
mgnify:CR=1|jgi:hypothetical protein|tara:strand:- start:26 stop:280 length:255 start_codon:yes stop_codon:yes gene_type:complete